MLTLNTRLQSAKTLINCAQLKSQGCEVISTLQLFVGQTSNITLLYDYRFLYLTFPGLP